MSPKTLFSVLRPLYSSSEQVWSGDPMACCASRAKTAIPYDLMGSRAGDFAEGLFGGMKGRCFQSRASGIPLMDQ